MNDTSEPAVTKTAAARLLTQAEVAELLGGEISTRTLEDWRRRGLGPDFIKLSGTKRGGGRVRYRPQAVDRWLDAHERGNAARIA